MMPVFRRRKTYSFIALLAVLTALAFSTVHLVHRYESGHDQSHCEVCLFLQSTTSALIPAGTFVALLLIFVATALQLPFQAIPTRSLFLPSISPRSPPTA